MSKFLLIITEISDTFDRNFSWVSFANYRKRMHKDDKEDYKILNVLEVEADSEQEAMVEWLCKNRRKMVGAVSNMNTGKYFIIWESYREFTNDPKKFGKMVFDKNGKIAEYIAPDMPIINLNALKIKVRKIKCQNK